MEIYNLISKFSNGFYRRSIQIMVRKPYTYSFHNYFDLGFEGTFLYLSRIRFLAAWVDIFITTLVDTPVGDETRTGIKDGLAAGLFDIVALLNPAVAAIDWRDTVEVDILDRLL